MQEDICPSVSPEIKFFIVRKHFYYLYCVLHKYGNDNKSLHVNLLCINFYNCVCVNKKKGLIKKGIT